MEKAMTFQQQIMATIIGSLTGFIFALILFFFSEMAKRKAERKILLQNLMFECQYNIEVLRPLIEELNYTWNNDLKNWRESEEFPNVEAGTFNWYMDYAVSRSVNFVSDFFEKVLGSGYAFGIIETKDVNKYISIKYLSNNWSQINSERKARFSQRDSSADKGKGLLEVFEGDLVKLKEYDDIAKRIITNIQKSSKFL